MYEGPSAAVLRPPRQGKGGVDGREGTFPPRGGEFPRFPTRPGSGRSVDEPPPPLTGSAYTASPRPVATLIAS